MLRAAVSSLVLFLLAVPAWADAECYGVQQSFEPGAILLGKVTAKKAVFHDDAHKPTAAYVIKGNEVLANPSEAGWVCATYINHRGVDTSGWLKATDVVLRDVSSPDAKDWLGDWTTGKWQNLTLSKGKKPGWINVSGVAYWAMSEETAKTGGLNEGGVDGEAPLEGGKLGFTQTQDETYKPYSEQARENLECAILVQVLSRNYLMAEDSTNCGGHNVRFTGIYARGKVEFSE